MICVNENELWINAAMLIMFRQISAADVWKFHIFFQGDFKYISAKPK